MGGNQVRYLPLFLGGSIFRPFQPQCVWEFEAKWRGSRAVRGRLARLEGLSQREDLLVGSGWKWLCWIIKWMMGVDDGGDGGDGEVERMVER